MKHTKPPLGTVLYHSLFSIIIGNATPDEKRGALCLAIAFIRTGCVTDCKEELAELIDRYGPGLHIDLTLLATAIGSLRTTAADVQATRH